MPFRPTSSSPTGIAYQGHLPAMAPGGITFNLPGWRLPASVSLDEVCRVDVTAVFGSGTTITAYEFEIGDYEPVPEYGAPPSVVTGLNTSMVTVRSSYFVTFNSHDNAVTAEITTGAIGAFWLAFSVTPLGAAELIPLTYEPLELSWAAGTSWPSDPIQSMTGDWVELYQDATGIGLQSTEITDKPADPTTVDEGDWLPLNPAQTEGLARTYVETAHYGTMYGFVWLEEGVPVETWGLPFPDPEGDPEWVAFPGSVFAYLDPIP